MPATLRLLFTAFTLAMTSTLPAASESPLPRYALTPGTEMIYRTVYAEKTSLGQATGQTDLDQTLTVQVLRTNADGSSRLILRAAETRTHTSGQQRQPTHTSTTLLYVDLFPDGRQLPMAHIELAAYPLMVFPALPRNDAEQAAGWDAAVQDYRCVSKATAASHGFEFDSNVISPFDTLLQDTHTGHFTFDPHRGLMTHSEDQFRRSRKVSLLGREETELLSSGPMPEPAFALLKKDADVFFAAVEEYRTAIDQAERTTSNEAKKLLDQAAADLKGVAATLSHPDFKNDVDDWLREHDRRTADILARDQQIADQVGHAAPNFSADDLNGNAVHLADLRGKVVVLDFNYRGCGPCFRSIPQMNQLAADFANQPVAIFSMSVDKDPADARFMTEKMGVTYPTLLARTLHDQFNVVSVQCYSSLINRGLSVISRMDTARHFAAISAR